MAKTPEGKVKARIDVILKSFGSAIWWVKVPANGYGRAGIPDYNLIVNGYGMVIEAKATERERPTALQELELRNVGAAGGVALVLHEGNVECLLDILQDMIASTPAVRMHHYRSAAE